MTVKERTTPLEHGGVHVGGEEDGAEREQEQPGEHGRRLAGQRVDDRGEREAAGQVGQRAGDLEGGEQQAGEHAERQADGDLAEGRADVGHAGPAAGARRDHRGDEQREREGQREPAERGTCRWSRAPVRRRPRRSVRASTSRNALSASAVTPGGRSIAGCSADQRRGCGTTGSAVKSTIMRSIQPPVSARTAPPMASLGTMASVWSCTWKTTCTRLMTMPTIRATASSGPQSLAASTSAWAQMWTMSVSFTTGSPRSSGRSGRGWRPAGTSRPRRRRAAA